MAPGIGGAAAAGAVAGGMAGIAGAPPTKGGGGGGIEPGIGGGIGIDMRNTSVGDVFQQCGEAVYRCLSGTTTLDFPLSKAYISRMVLIFVNVGGVLLY